jgi:hypothetical protein
VAGDSPGADATGAKRPILGRIHCVGPARLMLPRMAPIASTPHITQSRRRICAHSMGAL